MSRARVAVVGLLLSGAAPASVLADNCDGLSDCGVAVKIALAVLAVVAVLVLLEVAPLLFGAELAAEAAAAEGAAAVEAAAAAEAAAEAAAMAEEIDIAIGIQEAIEAAEAAESAAAAAEASAAADVGTAEYLQSIARTVNSTRGTMNCQTCTEAVSRALGGELGSLAPHSNEMLTLYGLAEQAGGSVGLSTSAAGIEAEMAAAQAGEEAWVVVAENAPNGVSHIFNAVNFAGEVFYVDGQLGVVGQSVAEVAAAAGYTDNVVFYLVSFF